MDMIADVLGTIRLSGGVFLDAQFTEPWAIRTKLLPSDCVHLIPGPVQFIGYHLVLDGRLDAAIEGEPAVQAEAGDIILVPRNEMHVLSNGKAALTLDSRDILQAPDGEGLVRIRHGGGGAGTHIVCGFLASQYSFNPLIETLPRLLKVDTRSAASHDWIEASIRYAAGRGSSGGFASTEVVTRLSEVLLVEAVRQYSASLPQAGTGWLRGAGDPQTGKALALMHRDLHSHWSEDTLAREAGMSRSSFVERFTRLVGTPPIRYLTSWRLQAARQCLEESPKSVQQVADAVGYASPEAFSRAFKREFGRSPAQWRNGRGD